MSERDFDDDFEDDEDDEPREAPHEEPHEQEGPFTHAPVMAEEVLDWLAPERHATPILYDLTLGLGGHARAWLERAGPGARAFGLDADPVAIERTAPRLAEFGDRVTLVHAPLRDVGRVARERGWPRPTSALLDLGLSSPQIEEDARGFSYRREGPLDMRFDPTQGPTAAELLMSMTTAELAHEIEYLGDEPHALDIVKLIKRRLPVETTTQLTAIVLEAYGRRPSRVHPARRIFQALRIMVNDELGAIDRGLTEALELLGPGGRVVTLTYHSGEDRVVKDVLRGAARRGEARRLTRRVGRPTDAECLSNRRARSAKLRCSEKMA